MLEIFVGKALEVDYLNCNFYRYCKSFSLHLNEEINNFVSGKRNSLTNNSRIETTVSQRACSTLS